MSGLRADLEQRFEFVRELGRGSFGSVHEVRDRERGERFALKLLGEGADLERVEREIEASLLLAHPRVIRCYEGERRGDEAYLLLDLAEGTLEQQIRDPERLAENWKLLRQAADGVAAIHNLDLVHRDLKPGNILLGPRGARVSDLGLAKGGDLVTLTRTGVLVGTPGYMSPEQVAGRKLTPASDLFSLAVMFYEAVEGRLPWASAEPVAMVLSIAQGEIQGFSRGYDLLEGHALETLRRGLDPDPERRPGNVARWIEELGAYQPPTEASKSASARRTLTMAAPALEPGAVAGAPGPAPAPAPAPRALPRWFLLVGAAALAGLGFLSGGPFAPRVADPRDAWPPPLVQALGRDFPERVLAELEATVEKPWARDPAAWDRLLGASPALLRFRAWVGGGGSPRTLPGDLVEDLRRCDRHFQDLGLPAPFRVPLETSPGGQGVPLAPRQRELLARRLPPESVPAVLSGWAATAAEALDRAVQAERLRRARLAEHLGGTEDPGLPAALQSRGGLQPGLLGGLDLEGGVDGWLAESWARPEGRAALEVWLREDRRALARALFATGRALALEPGDRDPLLALVAAELGQVRLLWFGSLASLEPGALLCAPGTGEPVEYLALLLQDAVEPVRAALDPAPAARAVARRRRAHAYLAHLPLGPAAAARWWEVFDSTLTHAGAEPAAVLGLYRVAWSPLRTLARRDRYPRVLGLAEALVAHPDPLALAPAEWAGIREDIEVMRRLEPDHGTVDVESLLRALAQRSQ